MRFKERNYSYLYFMGNWAKAIKINVDVFFFYQILQEHLWMQVLQVDVFLPLLHSFLHPAAPPLQNLHCAHGPLKCNTIRNYILELSHYHYQSYSILTMSFQGITHRGHTESSCHTSQDKTCSPHFDKILFLALKIYSSRKSILWIFYLLE